MGRNGWDANKSLSSIEARALIYQKILLESELEERLKLLKILKNSFKKDNIEKAFDEELKTSDDEHRLPAEKRIHLKISIDPSDPSTSPYSASRII